MTPTAVTPAARAKRPSATRPSAGAGSGPHPSTPRGGHRATVTRRPAPRGTRRVSGPARSADRPADRATVGQTSRPTPSARAVAAAAAVAGSLGAVPARSARPVTGSSRPARDRTAARPRRVSGPARPGLRPRTATPEPRRPLATRSLSFLRALPDHSLLDRVVRGRIWIPLLGVLLVGIVAMQVEVLKLNAGIGRSTVQAAAFQTENQQLRASVAQLGSDQTIESEAAKMGMKTAAPTSIGFLAGGGSQTVARAASAIHAPDASSFAYQLQARTARAASAAAAAGSAQADSTDE